MPHGLLTGVLALALLGDPAGEGQGWVRKIETAGELERLSRPESFLPGVLRSVKYLAPVRQGDPELLPFLFQNVNLYRFHQDFLAAEFPERFPGLGGEEYLNLVERRATRKYFAGVLYRFAGEPPTYGFDVFTAGGSAAELPTVEEAGYLHGRISESFTLGTVAYAPGSLQAIRNAEGWENPGFPINFTFGGGLPEYIPYTKAVNYGIVKIFTPEEFATANERGAFSFQDIVVLAEAPTDIEGVVAGAITGGLQGELGHLAIRLANRGTPNAYVREAPTVFEKWKGKVVRLAIGATAYEVTETTLAEAEAWWASHRPRLPELPDVERNHTSLDAAWEIPVDGSVRLVTRYGGKASNFARLFSIIDEEHRVPAFVVPFHYYLQFIETNLIESRLRPGTQLTYAEYIEEMLSDPVFRSDSRTRFAVLDDLRDHMEDEGNVDQDVVSAVQRRIIEVFGTPTFKVRFRSSSNVEDLIEFNAAGLYSSTSGCVADDFDSDRDGPSLCDPAQPDERSVARGLRRVWASLWNFRAFEERAYYQIPHTRARMAVLVSEAFPDELVNGVAFTGNPSARGDRRYFITSQIGDTPVVFPEPNVLPAKDLLTIEGGVVASILRVRKSTLAPAGQDALSDDQLRELGAAMARVEGRIFDMIDVGSYPPDRILLDFEFKFDKRQNLRLKQVRPFLLSETVEATRTYRLVVPEGSEACGSFAEAKPALEVYRQKIRMKLREGAHELRVDGTSQADIFEWIELAEGGPRIPPTAPGRWNAQVANGAVPGYVFTTSQEFRDGSRNIIIGFDNIFLPEEGPDELVLDGPAYTWTVNPNLITLAAYLNGIDDLAKRVPFLPCNPTHLPFYTVDVDLGAGDTIHIEERFQDLDEGTGPAEIVKAEVSIAGDTRTVDSYWKLVYTAGHHNDTPRPTHWIVLDTPIEVPFVGTGTIISVVNGHRGENPRAFLLDAEFRETAELFVVSLRRLKEGLNPLAFRRGDVDYSRSLSIGDAVLILRHLFGQYSYLECADTADVDDGGTIDIGDAISILLYLYQGFDPPEPPGLECGEDDLDDDLPICFGPGCQ